MSPYMQSEWEDMRTELAVLLGLRLTLERVYTGGARAMKSPRDVECCVTLEAEMRALRLCVLLYCTGIWVCLSCGGPLIRGRDLLRSKRWCQWAVMCVGANTSMRVDCGILYWPRSPAWNCIVGGLYIILLNKSRPWPPAFCHGFLTWLYFGCHRILLDLVSDYCAESR